MGSIQKFGCSSLDEYLQLRSRNHAVECYCTEEELQIILCKHYKQIIHFAFNLHDCDVFDSGEKAGQLKQPHFHICLHLNNDYSIEQVISWFKEKTNGNVFDELLLYKTRCYQYLCHSNHPDKYQYDENLVVTDNKGFWYNKESRAMSIIFDYLHSQDEVYMCNTYGREWIVNGAKYKEAAHKMSRKVQEPYLLDGKILDKKNIEVLSDVNLENSSN